MNFLRDIVTRSSLPGRAVLLLTGTLLLSACATPQLDKFTTPPLLHAGPEVQLPDIDVLAVTPEMEEFLERYISQYVNSTTKVHLLSNSMGSTGVLGFEYDDARTLTAAEAFKSRTGNCIGFSNMMIALARQAGLKASYQEIIRRPVWSSRDDTVLLLKHVNVVIEGRNFDYVMDISDVKINQMTQRRIVDDSYAKALYLNNLGVEALFANDLPTAYAYMNAAIAVDPNMTDSWVNMGVVFGRNEQLNDAVKVLKRALQVDPNQYSAMNNLYEIYVEQGDLLAADSLQTRVDRYRRANPYYLLHLSDEAVELKQFEESISLLRRAIRKKDDDHVLHYALAKTQYLSGETQAAETSLVRARELAPQDKLAYYARPLDELIAEEQAERDVLIP
ncbi:MAG: tetratricopeptide repeat protein [Gammaproteobacteria bacterium]|nr:tetratricopeptide repeat protein [Gammaproteobacteria bacterium]